MPVALKLAARLAPSPLAIRLGGSGSTDVSFVHGVHGGTVFGDVTSHTDGSDFFATKELGPPRNDAFAIAISNAVSGGLFDWVAGSWSDQPGAKDGAILGCDFDYEIRSERGFVGALIHETAFPALDAASKQAGFITLGFTPQAILEPTSPGTKLSLSLGLKPKLWLTSNFKLQIDGLDCSKVSRIDPFRVRRPVDVVTSGHGPALHAGPIDFPSLRIILSPVSLPSWASWHETFVIDGQNGPSFERSGSITFLSPNLEPLIRIDLSGLGISRLALPERDPERPNAVAHVVADLYCERMVLKPGDAP